MYKRRSSLAALFDISIRLVDILISEIEASPRYPKDSILKDKGYVLVDVDVFQDYLKNRQQLKGETTSKMLPKYQRNNIRYLNAVI